MTDIEKLVRDSRPTPRPTAAVRRHNLRILRNTAEEQVGVVDLGAAAAADATTGRWTAPRLQRRVVLGAVVVALVVVAAAGLATAARDRGSDPAVVRAAGEDDQVPPVATVAGGSGASADVPASSVLDSPVIVSLDPAFAVSSIELFDGVHLGVTWWLGDEQGILRVSPGQSTEVEQIFENDGDWFGGELMGAEVQFKQTSGGFIALWRVGGLTYLLDSFDARDVQSFETLLGSLRADPLETWRDLDIDEVFAPVATTAADDTDAVPPRPPTAKPSSLAPRAGDAEAVLADWDSDRAVHLPGWRPSFLTEVVACIYTPDVVGGGRVGGFPLAEEMTPQDLIDECNDDDRLRSGDAARPDSYTLCMGSHPSDVFAAYLAESRLEVVAGDYMTPRPLRPVLIGWEAGCSSVIVDTEPVMELVPFTSLAATNWVRRVHIGVAAEFARRCLSHEEAEASALAVLPSLGYGWVLVEWSDDVAESFTGEDCWQVTFDATWGTLRLDPDHRPPIATGEPADRQ